MNSKQRTMKKVLITGADKSIGLEAARQLLQKAISFIWEAVTWKMAWKRWPG